jgi:hypothetical protein
VRDLLITIRADGSQAKSELAAVDKGIGALDKNAEKLDTTFAITGKGIAKTLAGIGIALAAVDFAGMSKKAVDSTSKIRDAMDTMGITSAEATQKLIFAATQGGASMQALTNAVTTMSDKIADGKLQKTAEELGVSFEKLKAMTPDQAFLTMADAIRQVPDPMKQADLAMDAFGARAKTLLPAIRDGFVEVGNQAPVMSDAVVTAGDSVGDQMAKMQQHLENLQARALLPFLNFFTTNLPEGVQVGIAAIGSFMPSIESLLLGILAVGGPKAALAMLGEGFVAMGGYLATFGGFIMTLLSGAGAALVTFFTVTLPAAFGTIIAFLGPQGLIALALLALAGIWYFFGDEITAVVTKVYTAVKTWLQDKLGGVFTWLKEVLVAAVTGWVNLHLEILRIVQAIYTGVKTWLMDKLAEVWNAVKAKIEAVKGYFRDLYTAVVGNSYIPDMVQGIGDSIAQLDNVFVKPSQLANELVGNAFKAMTKVATDALSDLLKKVTGTFSDITTKVMPSFGSSGASTMSSIGKGFKENFLSAFGAGLGEGLVNLAGEGLKALWNHVRGGEEAQIVNPARDAFFAKFGGYEGLARQLTAASDGNIADQLIRVLYNADTEKAFQAAVQAIEDVLNGGGAAGGRSPAEVSLDNLGLSVTTTDAALQALSATWTGIAAAMAQGLTDATAQFDLVVASVERLNEAVLMAMQETWTVVSEGMLAGLLAITEAFTPLIAQLDLLTLDKLPELRRTFTALEDALLQSLGALTAAFDPLIGQVDRFTAALNAVPREVVVQMRVEQSEVPTPEIPEAAPSGFGGMGILPGDYQPLGDITIDRSQIDGVFGPKPDVFQPQEHELGFARGTGGKYLDFGSGTNVTLHGKERVMTEAEGRAEEKGESFTNYGSITIVAKDPKDFYTQFKQMLRHEHGAVKAGRKAFA